MVQSRVTFADAAYVVLVETGHEIHYKELAQRVLEAGLFTSKGKTPEQTLRSQIAREVKDKGDESRFLTRDAGKIELAPAHRERPDRELILTVLSAAGVAPADAEIRADTLVAGSRAVQEPGSTSEAALVEESAASPSGPEATDGPVAPAEAGPEATEEGGEPESFASDAGPADHDEGPGDAEGSHGDDVERTFATPEQDVVVYDAPDDFEREGSFDEAEVVVPVHHLEKDEDSDQDFLSLGSIRDGMESSQYDATMEELAPIVVPPHEGGAAEIARIPLGGRTVLIVKVVRRQDLPFIQLVEELESLVSGVVGRILLTLPGEDLADLVDALQTCGKVIEQSFTLEEGAEGRLARRPRALA